MIFFRWFSIEPAHKPGYNHEEHEGHEEKHYKIKHINISFVVENSL